MLIKFFRNGKGAGSGPVGYLVAALGAGWRLDGVADLLDSCQLVHYTHNICII